MLNSLVIKNFRMLEDFTVEKLGRVNLIVGKNNSGKSTVLEALRIYAGNANLDLLADIAGSHDEIFSIHVPPEDISDNTMNVIVYEDLFIDRKYPTNKDIKILIGESTSESSEKKLFIENYSSFVFGETDKNKISCCFVPTQFVPMDELEKEWKQIELTDGYDIVTQALQIIVPNFQRLAFDGNKEKRWVKVKLANLSKPVPLKSLGDGMLRILQIAIKLVSAQGGFLLIDEFENGLHYSVQENVWRLLFEMAEKLDIQVFATTHSWDCIESFVTVAQQKPEADAVLFRMGKSVGKSDYGKVISTVFSGDDLSYITQSNMEIR
jgi:predicted ATPase